MKPVSARNWRYTLWATCGFSAMLCTSSSLPGRSVYFGAFSAKLSSPTPFTGWSCVIRQATVHSAVRPVPDESKWEMRSQACGLSENQTAATAATVVSSTITCARLPL
jgi:hypothetical protein